MFGVYVNPVLVALIVTIPLVPFVTADIVSESRSESVSFARTSRSISGMA